MILDNGGVKFTDEPRRLVIVPKYCSTRDKDLAHVKASANVPVLRGNSRSGRLAVVGGGPSARAALPELLRWNGDIWGINGAAAWLASQGVSCDCVSVDPHFLPRPAPGVVRGIFASRCQPAVWPVYPLPRRFHLHEEDMFGGICGGTTTAGRTPHLAQWLGYEHVTYFGVEGSFTDLQEDRVYDHVGDNEVLVIQSRGEQFYTRLDLQLQCEDLAVMFRGSPGFLENRSGGLLQAMIDDPDGWEVVAVSDALRRQLIANGCNPAYWGDSQWQPRVA